MFISNLENISKIIDFFVSQNGMFRHVGYEATNPESVKLKKRNHEKSKFRTDKRHF